MTSKDVPRETLIRSDMPPDIADYLIGQFIDVEVLFRRIAEPLEIGAKMKSALIELADALKEIAESIVRGEVNMADVTIANMLSDLIILSVPEVVSSIRREVSEDL